MNVLVICPHPDDEVIGVGGTIAKRAEAGDAVFVCVVTRGWEPLFDNSIVAKTREECLRANKVLGVKETRFLDFPTTALEEVPRVELNDALSRVIQEYLPDEVYIPHRGDMQLDHQMVVDAAMVVVRPKYKHVPKRVLSYEVLSETGWNIPNAVNEFIPTVYEDITTTIQKKIQAMNVYESQLSPFPAARSVEAIKALAKYRGATVNVRAAEAFTLIREIRQEQNFHV